jgi:hypothetical protein
MLSQLVMRLKGSEYVVIEVMDETCKNGGKRDRKKSK